MDDNLIEHQDKYMKTHTSPQFRLEIIDEIHNVDDGNINVIVHCDNGKSYGISFFTKKNIFTLCARGKDTGEYLNGSYFWSIGSVIVEKLECTLLENIVADMLVFNDNSYRTLERSFPKITREPCTCRNRDGLFFEGRSPVAW